MTAPKRPRKSRSGTILSEERRRELGQERITVRFPEPGWPARLDALCELSGYTRAEQIMGMIQVAESDLDKSTEPK
jgi:hypothetical protein